VDGSVEDNVGERLSTDTMVCRREEVIARVKIGGFY